MENLNHDALALEAEKLWPSYTWKGAHRHHGAFHEVIRSLDGPLARIPIGSHAKERAWREYQIKKAFEQISFPVPVPVALSEPTEAAGRHFTLVSLVPGDATSDFATINEARKEAYRILLDGFHTARVPEGDVLPCNTAWCGGSTWSRTITGELWDRVPAEHRATASRAIEAAEGYCATVPQVLCHGDFGPHNIMWQGTQAVGLIDIDNAGMGDPAVDIAPLVGFHGASNVADLCDDATLNRALVYRCLLPLKVAAAAHLCGIPSMRDHALRNFAARGVSKTLFDPEGAQPTF